MKKALTTLLLLIMAAVSGNTAAATSREEYDALIIEARAGNHEPALEMLRRHAVEHPMDLRAAYDRILIASWAGQSGEVLRAYESLSPAPNRMPADVLGAVARAYRDTWNWERALALYQDGRRRFPADSSFAVGEVMVLADAGQPRKALTLGEELIKQRPSDADISIALGYAHLRNRSPYGVLQHASDAYTSAPNKNYVAREYIFALQQAGLSEAAVRTAMENPDAINAGELRDLQADYAAELARLAAMPSRSEAQRFDVADQAIGMYDRLIADWQAYGPEAAADPTRARVDRLHALHARVRMQDLVQEYETLLAEGVEVPRYALSDVASAYLYLRQPEKSSALYEKLNEETAARADDPSQRLTNQTGLFYALLESERFDEADAVIETAKASQAKWRWVRGQPERIPNELSLYVEQTAALGRAYAQDTVSAEQRLRELSDRAPNNTGLRSALAIVYRSREQPRRSEIELKMAETLTPRSLEVETGQAFTALDLQEWEQAELLVEDTVARAPEDLNVQRLAREWEVHNKAELRVSGNRGISSDSPVTGSGDFGIDTVLYSAPLSRNWRVFGGGGYGAGKFEEGDAHYRWLRTGVEWRSRDITVEGEVSTHSYGQGVKPGLRASATLDLNDHWQIGASGELRSRQTPLRALLNDVSSNSIGIFARWRANERREWNFAFIPSKFSDGNKRLALQVAGRERLYTAPRLRADLELDLSASRNSDQDVPYFSPGSDLYVVPSISLTHTLYRHYETVVEQRFAVGGGIYSQENHGTGGVATLGYGLRYRTNDVFEVGATVTGISRPYDGVREREVRIMFDMSVRF